MLVCMHELNIDTFTKVHGGWPIRESKYYAIKCKQRLPFVQIFPQLRQWCESEDRKLHLIDCDLRWVTNVYNFITCAKTKLKIGRSRI